MVWNELGGNCNDNDFWGIGGCCGDDQGLLDFDEVLKKGFDKLNCMLGGKGSKFGGSGGSFGSGVGGFGVIIVLVVILVVGYVIF